MSDLVLIQRAGTQAGAAMAIFACQHFSVELFQDTLGNPCVRYSFKIDDETRDKLDLLNDGNQLGLDTSQIAAISALFQENSDLLEYVESPPQSSLDQARFELAKSALDQLVH